MSGKVSPKRHLAKAITWRVVASMTTFALALLVFGRDEYVLQKATTVALCETLLKMGLYYAHERAWYRIGWGVEKDAAHEP